ncbi:MAG: fucose isomerase [Succinivibrio sp.]|nr:fucose isomerase [Succinivibrio sp.]
MLKGIPEVITPDLLYALAAMGHGDSLVLADANFPAYRLAENHTLVHLPTVSMPDLLTAVLDLFPIDALHQDAAYVMEVTKADTDRGVKTPIWGEYRNILQNKTQRNSLGLVDRQKFYDLAASSQVIVLTGERALYANILLYKGTL